MEFNKPVDIWRALTLQTSSISGLCLRPMNQDSHPFLNSPTLFLFLGYFFWEFLYSIFNPNIQRLLPFLFSGHRFVSNLKL